MKNHPASRVFGTSLPCFIVALGLWAGSAVHAATFTVTNTNDAGPGSLRQALAEAQASSGVVDTIEFDVGLNGGTITLADTLGTADADGVTVDATALADGLTILQTGVNKRGFFNTGVLTLRGLTITGASAPVDEGGGAVFSEGTLVLDRCDLSGNAGELGGGGLWNEGAATVIACTLSHNTGRTGAAILNGFAATLTIEHSTIAENTTAGTDTLPPGDYSIYNDGTLTLRHCTVAANLAPGGSGAVRNEPGDTLTIENCILGGGNEGTTDLSNAGTLVRVGANLAEKAPVDTGGGSSSGPAIIVADPLLGPLGQNGGPTPTMGLLAGSPAIDAAVGSSEVRDQRGALRPIDGDNAGGAVADLGTFELGNAFLQSLTLSAGTLVPAFDAATMTYTVEVADTVTAIVVTPTVAQASSTITVNGAPVASGTPSASLPLEVGANVITTAVTAEDGVTTKTYSVTVTRAVPADGVLVTGDDTGPGSLRDTLHLVALTDSTGTIFLGGQTLAMGSAFNPYPLLRPATGAVTIDGGGATIDGGGMNRPFFVYSGEVTLKDLSLVNVRAFGGNGGTGAGGGAGLGGAIFVYSGAHAIAENVTFGAASAAGGAGGADAATTGVFGGGGGGGGMGGDGGLGSVEGGSGGGGLGGDGGVDRAGGGGGGIREGMIFTAHGGGGAPAQSLPDPLTFGGLTYPSPFNSGGGTHGIAGGFVGPIAGAAGYEEFGGQGGLGGVFGGGGGAGRLFDGGGVLN